MGTLNFFSGHGDSTLIGRAKALWVPDKYKRRYFEHEFANVRRYYSGSLQNLSFPAGNHHFDAPTTDFGFMLKFAALLNAYKKNPAIIAFRGKGGCSLAPIADSGVGDGFFKGDTGLYNTVVGEINTAKSDAIAEGWTINHVAHIIMLGLNDTLTDAAANDFEANLTQHIADLTSDLSLPSTTLIIVAKPNGDTVANGINGTRYNTISGAIDNVEAANSLVRVADLTGLDLISGDIHQSWKAEVGREEGGGYDDVATLIYDAIYN